MERDLALLVRELPHAQGAHAEVRQVDLGAVDHVVYVVTSDTDDSSIEPTSTPLAMDGSEL